MKFLRLLLVFISPILSDAQTIKGYIYDAEATVKGAKIINSTQTILSYSNDKGVFEIKAKPNDTIVISSYFHFEKTLVLIENHFKETIVIELKKITTELDAVLVNETLEKEIDAETTNNGIKMQISNDIKENPHLYNPPPNTNMDFIAIAKLIGKLFKKKNKTPNVTYITTDDLVTLFETHSLFNQNMLISDLNIPKDYQYLFFDYCTVNNLKKDLITKHNGMELLELLNIYSKEFNQLLIEYKKE